MSAESRAFSIAMTACAAKFCNKAVVLGGEGPGFLGVVLTQITPRSALSLRSGIIRACRDSRVTLTSSNEKGTEPNNRIFQGGIFKKRKISDRDFGFDILAPSTMRLSAVRAGIGSKKVLADAYVRQDRDFLAPMQN